MEFLKVRTSSLAILSIALIILIFSPWSTSASANSDLDTLNINEESLEKCDESVTRLSLLLESCTETNTTFSSTTISSSSSSSSPSTDESNSSEPISNSTLPSELSTYPSSFSTSESSWSESISSSALTSESSISSLSTSESSWSEPINSSALTSESSISSLSTSESSSSGQTSSSTLSPQPSTSSSPTSESSISTIETTTTLAGSNPKLIAKNHKRFRYFENASKYLPTQTIDKQMIQNKIRDESSQYVCDGTGTLLNNIKRYKGNWNQDVNFTLYAIDDIVSRIKSDPLNVEYAEQLNNETDNLNSLITIGNDDPTFVEESDVSGLQEHATDTSQGISDSEDSVKNEIHDKEKQRKVTISLSTIGAVLLLVIIVALVFVYVKWQEKKRNAERGSTSSSIDMVKIEEATEKPAQTAGYQSFMERFGSASTQSSGLKYIPPVSGTPSTSNPFLPGRQEPSLGTNHNSQRKY